MKYKNSKEMNMCFPFGDERVFSLEKLVKLQSCVTFHKLCIDVGPQL